MKTVKVDFVSDVVCPWCAIGLASLEDAMSKVEGDIKVELHFRPFELNPQMGPEGEDIKEHLSRKYNLTEQQLAENEANLLARAEAAGVHFDLGLRSRTYNTFDAHRLLFWAAPQGKEYALKKALLDGYFAKGMNPSDRAQLLDKVAEVGLSREEAATILESSLFTEEVRTAEEVYRKRGINSVPSIVLNDKYLITGGQSSDYFEMALRQVADESEA
ncbi:DsbA family oxidoreductase [Gallaecimonas pentaromativorans]|uniref:Putative DsbA family dithiol-disulfide isomerase n=1 Tax=Gallaecimonas pentaromativorans TaxID=584787 RepID=A0A3N1P8Q8_9GAMM|nr:DsbA family oxidoreductase [Gallaecimonas pentaromativorans]MED5524929.1 DsbA family oxidoreductase [Pseudomonadota bacterium]ROQ24128.1 putative DsbA family dithiol-disulfide isomerase [Gallaecimonas pentaromativorans]